MSELMPWHKTWLIDPSYNRVDLVKEGANSQAHIKLFKSKGGTPMTLEEILKGLKPEHAEVVKAAFDKVQADADAAIAKAKEEAQEEIAKSAPVAETEEDILKSVKDPAVRALLETQIAKTKAAEAEVRKANETRDNAEAIAKAKEVPNLGAEEQALATVYKKLKAVDGTLADDVFGIFKAASALINESGAFTEVGKSAGNTEGDSSSESAAWAKIESAADAIAKSANISKSAAISRAIEENPGLYRAYVDAQTK